MSTQNRHVIVIYIYNFVELQITYSHYYKNHIDLLYCLQNKVHMKY